MNNNLNSLILEGVVVGEPHHLEERNVLNFTIEVARYYKTRDGDDATELSQFKVVAFGGMCNIPVKEGMGVRVVGRLKQVTWEENSVTHSEVQVVAEYIEIRKTK